MCCSNEAGSYLRLTHSCITQLKAQGPSRICNKSEGEEPAGEWPRTRRAEATSGCHPRPPIFGLGFGVWGLGFGVRGSGSGVWGAGCGVRGCGDYPGAHPMHRRLSCPPGSGERYYISFQVRGVDTCALSTLRRAARQLTRSLCGLDRGHRLFQPTSCVMVDAGTRHPVLQIRDLDTEDMRNPLRSGFPKPAEMRRVAFLTVWVGSLSSPFSTNLMCTGGRQNPAACAANQGSRHRGYVKSSAQRIP